MLDPVLATQMVHELGALLPRFIAEAVGRRVVPVDQHDTLQPARDRWQ